PVPSAMLSNSGVSSGMVGRIMEDSSQTLRFRNDNRWEAVRLPGGTGDVPQHISAPFRRRPLPQHGWKKLVDSWPWYAGEGRFPVRPGSEFMSPLYVVRKPYGCLDPILPDDHDPFGWPITEYEEALSIRPGLRDVAQRVLHKLECLCRGDAHGFDEDKLTDNPYWPPELATQAAALRHERFVLLLPLALSQTQDDKARVRWTLYGNSEQGP